MGRRIVYFIDHFMVSVATVSIILMMITIVYDVVMRYFFGHSSTFSYNLSECYLMTAIVFFGVAYTKKLDGHTRVLLVYKKFPQVLRKYFDLLANILTLIIFAVIGYMGLLLTIRAYVQTEMYIGIYTWPLYMAYIIMPIGALSMVFQCLVDIYDSVKILVNKDLDAIEHQDQSVL